MFGGRIGRFHQIGLGVGDFENAVARAGEADGASAWISIRSGSGGNRGVSELRRLSPYLSRIPRRCSVSITCGNSSSPNPAFARAVKCRSPQYTASAPASSAGSNCGHYPAALITSGLRPFPMAGMSSA
jgi:hypothetical protein